MKFLIGPLILGTILTAISVAIEFPDPADVGLSGPALWAVTWVVCVVGLTFLTALQKAKEAAYKAGQEAVAKKLEPKPENPGGT